MMALEVGVGKGGKFAGGGYDGEGSENGTEGSENFGSVSLFVGWLKEGMATGRRRRGRRRGGGRGGWGIGVCKGRRPRGF